MNPAYWKPIAIVTVLAAIAMLAASLITQSRQVRASTAAVAVLDSVTLQLDTANAVIARGAEEAGAYQQRIDSLWTVIQRIQYAPPSRQHTLRVIDTADARDVVMALATMTAERDTAIADRDSVIVALGQLRVGADALRLAAIVHARADSVRFAQLSAVIDTVETQVHTARAMVRPRWYRRWGATIGRAAKVSGIAALAFAVGRAT
jgi:hypothetical protein